MQRKLTSHTFNKIIACLFCSIFFIAYSSPITYLIKYYHAFAYTMCAIAIFLSSINAKPKALNFTLLDILGFIFIILISLNIFLTYSININWLYPLNMFNGTMLYIAFRQNKQIQIGVIEILSYVLLFGLFYGILETCLGEEIKWIFFNSTVYANFIILIFSLSIPYLYFREFPEFNANRKYQFCILILVMLGLLFFTFGRIAIFAFLISIFLVILFNRKYISKLAYRALCAAMVLSFSILVMSLLFHKTGSTSGRLFIWNLIVENANPVWLKGNGFGQFRSYFTNLLTNHWTGSYTESDLFRADIIEYAFNDYFQLFSEGGILIVASYLLLLGYSLYVNFKNVQLPIAKSNLIFLLAFIIISFASYNLYQFPFIFLLALSLSFTSSLGTIRYSLNLSGWNVRLFKTTVSVVYLSIIAIQIFFVLNYSFIKEVFQRPIPITYEVLKRKKPLLRFDKDILYELSLSNFNKGNYQEAVQLMLASGRISESIDANLLLGRSYLALKKYELANTYLINAGKIHPGRFKPKYYLFEFYNEVGNKEKLRDLCLDIINTPIKVDSEEVRLLRRKAVDKLEELKFIL